MSIKSGLKAKLQSVITQKMLSLYIRLNTSLVMITRLTTIRVKVIIMATITSVNNNTTSKRITMLLIVTVVMYAITPTQRQTVFDCSLLNFHAQFFN